MSPDSGGGPAPAADAGVILDYPAARQPADPLVLGPGARLRSGSVLYRGCVIGARLETGHVTILSFVRIGPGALVGAGATVTRDVPEVCVVFGNPAVVRGRVSDLTRIEARVEAVHGSAARYRLTGGTA